LIQLPDIVESCALSFEPHRLAEYLQDVAGAFHKFYHVHRVISDDLPLMAARMALCRATRAVLRNGFAVLGIAAPDQM
ncbi:MAG: DALR anticodon-binding domain-containing protein, partial [Ignavibacteria bacterium]|nr:DALR anticodon-binding domain-containing protein [Ignavibacteria bacterium]